MTRLIERPVIWFVISTALVSALMRALPAYTNVGNWIITALAVLMGSVMVVWPERSGFNTHPTGVRLAGIVILCVWAILIARNVINFVQGA
jgi:hypothetical protein